MKINIPSIFNFGTPQASFIKLEAALSNFVCVYTLISNSFLIRNWNVDGIIAILYSFLVYVLLVFNNGFVFLCNKITK
jgi:hypothetical protein